MRKYLEDIGIDVNECCIPGSEDINDDRIERYMLQREEFGFDERETWSLDFTYACWLYEHLKMFMDKASEQIDLSFHKFKVPVVTEENKDNGKLTTTIQEKTQSESISLCIEYLEKYLKEKDVVISEDIGYEYRRVAAEIFTTILPAMWW